jgi:hypothetical protein
MTSVMSGPTLNAFYARRQSRRGSALAVSCLADGEQTVGVTDHYADGTYRWWHLSVPSPELVEALAGHWLPSPGPGLLFVREPGGGRIPLMLRGRPLLAESDAGQLHSALPLSRLGA